MGQGHSDPYNLEDLEFRCWRADYSLPFSRDDQCVFVNCLVDLDGYRECSEGSSEVFAVRRRWSTGKRHLIFYFLYVSLVCFLIYIYQGWKSWIQNDRWKILNSVFGLMVMGVFAETRNGFECFYNCNIFCFPDLGKQFSTVVFWYSAMYVTKIIRINPDNVASRGAVGRTHIIVRFQAGNRRKDHGTENFGGFVYV